jgi:putative DNA primase/helicase
VTTASDIADALGGHRAGDGFLVRCPVPTHGQGRGDQKPSLSIHDGDERLLVRCFAGCDARDVLAELRRRGLLYGDGQQYERQIERRPHPEPVHEPDLEAVAIWGGAGPIADTTAERYLRGRGITIPLPPTLRASTGLHLGRYPFPVIVAAVQRPSDRTVVAVQRTFLALDGSHKASIAAPRQTTGALGTGAVRLGPAGDVLGLVEGIETGLSAMQISGVPAWCCLGAGRMCRVVIPSVVHELHVFADDDEPGRAAAERTAAQHTSAGRRVVLRYPPSGCNDWNDALVAASREVAA